MDLVVPEDKAADANVLDLVDDAEDVELVGTMSSSDGEDAKLISLNGVDDVSEKLKKFSEKYEEVTAIILILFGIWLAFRGGQVVDTLFQVILTIAAAFLTGFLTFFVLKKLEVDLTDLINFLVLAFAIVVGILVGKKSWEYKRVGMLTLAVFMGIMVGFTISNTVKNKDEVILYIILGVCSLLGYYLMEKYEYEFILYSTSFIGSYCIVRGASIFIGDFPSETEISDSEHSNAFYGYLAAIILLTVAASQYQKRHGSGGSIFGEGGSVY